MTELSYSPLAQEDLDGIYHYIRDELANPCSANRIITYIKKRIEMLRNHPEMGPRLDSIYELGNGDTCEYRFLVCRHYIVYYLFKDDSINILRVLYGHRDVEAELFGQNN